MQTISTNFITQKEHSQYHAVDIGPSPDIDYYAPEDGVITGVGESGTCGFRLGVKGATGDHGFCHNEEIYVKVGDRVKRGQKLAKMGYTGYTIPSGPQGRHVHWVILKDGNYVYPPSLVNETFKKLGDDMVQPTEQQVYEAFRRYAGKEPDNPAQVRSYMAQDIRALYSDILEYEVLPKAAEAEQAFSNFSDKPINTPPNTDQTAYYTNRPAKFLYRDLATDLKKRLDASGSPSQYEQISESLYRKKT